jgi:hypothetical protein
MKKFLVTILALIYMFTSTGATVHMHYCMGQLVNWGLWHEQSPSACHYCGMDKNQKDNCCKDDHKFIKNNNDQKIAETAVTLIQAFSLAETTTFSQFTAPVIASVTETYPLSNAPPRTNATAIHISNCVFLI